MKIAFIDFETYYSDEYSLSKMTATEYIWDERFYAHGMAVSVDGADDEWITGRHLKEFWGDMAPHIDAICAHNTRFDGGILAKHFCSKRFFLLDTMSCAQGAYAARYPELSLSLASLAKQCFPDRSELWKMEGGLDPSKGLRELPIHVEQQLATYAKQDCRVMRALFEHLLKEDYPWETELENINITLSMGVYPQVCMNTLKAAAIHAEETRRKEEIVRELGIDRAMLRSSKAFAALLEAQGVEPPTKISPKTGQETYAFAAKDPGMVALLEHEDLAVQALAQARVGEKAAQAESRAATFNRLPSPCPVPMQYAAAATGRHGGREFNLLNLQRGSALRGCIEAPPGHKLLVSDLSQIELRMVAWWCDESWLVEALRQGRDIYCELGSAIFGREITKADVVERYVAKQAKLSCQYQVGHAKLLATVKQSKLARDFINEEIARKAVQTDRKTHPATVKVWDWLQFQAIPALAGVREPVRRKGVRFEKGRAILPSGRSLWYPEIHVDENGDWVFQSRSKTKKAYWKKLYGGALLENLSQAMSFDVFMFHARLLREKGLRLALAVYDEMGFVVRAADAEGWKEVVEDVQSRVPEWAIGLPCKGEGNYGDSYLEAK